jgi:uncharacterized membrane protein
MDFENYPSFMENVKSVTRSGEETCHWIMEGPMETLLEWDAHLTRIDPNQRIAWNSKEGGDIKTSAQVTFTDLPQDRVEITMNLQYVPPAGLAGKIVDALFGDTEGMLKQSLRNFKAQVESAPERSTQRP